MEIKWLFCISLYIYRGYQDDLFTKEIMEEYLKKIVENTTLKRSFQVILTGNDSRLSTNFFPALEACRYEIALVSLETYYSFPNIDDGNNRILVFLTKWICFHIPEGCYELKAIDKELQKQIIQAGGKKDDVKLSPNLNTFKCEMELNEGIQVDFRGENSIRTVLGFEAKLYTKNATSKDTVNIMRVNSILVFCDLIGSSYLNSSQEPISYSFFPNSSPGEKIVMHPTTLIYLPVSLDVIPQMTAWLTDQDKKPLNLRGGSLIHTSFAFTTTEKSRKNGKFVKYTKKTLGYS